MEPHHRGIEHLIQTAELVFPAELATAFVRLLLQFETGRLEQCNATMVRLFYKPPEAKAQHIAVLLYAPFLRELKYSLQISDSLFVIFLNKLGELEGEAAIRPS